MKRSIASCLFAITAALFGVAAVVVSAGGVAWATLGTELAPWQDPRPAVSVSQTNGCSCGPEKTGPVIGWLITVRRSWSAVIVLPPSASPSSSRVSPRPGSTRPFTRTVAFAGTRTSTSPPVTMSGRVDSVLIPASADPGTTTSTRTAHNSARIGTPPRRGSIRD